MDSLDFQSVLDARTRLQPYLKPSPFREYGELNEWIGHGIRVFVKHENHLPTNAFKVRNALSAMTMLSEESRKKGVIAATRGNHGLGVALAGKLLGVAVTICVPEGNNLEKNAGIEAFGANLIVRGKDFDQAIQTMQELVASHGFFPIHSSNCVYVLSGAATMSLEMIEQEPDLDAVVLSVGGGSQAAGAAWVAHNRKPGLAVYGVQAEGASAIHDSWHLGTPQTYETANTFADGLATRSCYEKTFPILKKGLKDFVKVSDDEIAEAVRVYLRTTHNLAEGAGAAGLAGLARLKTQLAGKKVGVVLSGGNMDSATLKRILNNESFANA